jgi:hypothetical protein
MSSVNIRILAVVALVAALALDSHAQLSSANYIRAREFALRFGNVISVSGKDYTIGRKNEDPQRLTVTSGSRDAFVGGPGGRPVRLARAAKVDNRGLLIPASALRYLGCSVAAQDASATVTCDGKSYALQSFRD